MRTFEKFEERLNLLFSLSDEEYKQKLERKHDYLMENINTIDYLKEFLKMKINFFSNISDYKQILF